jgi:hypothetical protein
MDTRGSQMSDAANNPYEMYKQTSLWKTIDEAITDLVENRDIVEMTRRDYIVGYICKKLESPQKPDTA